MLRQKLMEGFFDFGGFSPEDFSPVTIELPEKPLDEMTQPELRRYLLDLRLANIKEQKWQKEIGMQFKDRLIRLAEMYVEVQAYYAMFDEALAKRIASSEYMPVLVLDGKVY